MRLPPQVPDRFGDGSPLPAECERLLIVPGQAAEGRRAREGLAEHREIADLAPERACLVQALPSSGEVADRRVEPPDVRQRERHLFARVQLAREREGSLAGRHGLRVVAAPVDVQVHQVPQRLGLGLAVAELARQRHGLLRGASSVGDVELRGGRREQGRQGHRRLELDRPAARSLCVRPHLLVVLLRFVVAAGELEGPAAVRIEVREELVLGAEPACGVDRGAVVRDRVGVGVEPGRMVAGQARVAERPLVVARLAEMVREHGRELLEPVGVQLLHRGPHAQVERSAIPQEDRFVGRLLGEAVVERVLASGGPDGLADQPGSLEGVQSPAQLRTVAGHGAQDRLIEGAPDHRRELQRASRVLVQGVEARRDRSLQGGRDRVVRALHLDRCGQLLQEQGVALGALQDPFPDRLGSRSLGQELVDQRAAVLLRQRRQRDLDGSMRVLGLEPPLQSPGRRVRVRAEREDHE